MMVHSLSAPQRRMLLEMLVSERAGEHALRVGRYMDREHIANSLCRLLMVDWVTEQEIIFTEQGRTLAEHLADWVVDRTAYAARAC